MATEMTNIEIRDFMSSQSVRDNDFVVLSLFGGTSAKMAVGLFRSAVSSSIKPSIKDSVWWIGDVNTEVVAEGKTPQFRQGSLGIEWKYTYEPDTAWRLLVAIEDIVFTFDELTPEQRDLIKLKYSDLTPEEIAELQRPANDMIAVLDKTNKDVQAAEDARVKEFATLKAESEAATDDAQDTADHPTYVGTDNYVYQWNKATKTYDKTAIYVRGEAFSIKKVYSSVSSMYADTSTVFKEGDFCLINTNDVENPENAQLFVRSSIGSWDFLVDMSGAIGFTGKVPQLFIGTVTIGSGKDSAAVTLSPAGTDTDGNPKYNINYVIPCLAYEDLTPGQIAELQRPSNEMIAVLQATDNRINANEQVRIKSEDERISAETERKEAETERKEAEAERKESETERKSSETGRKEAETERKESEVGRKEAESERKTAETERKESETERKGAEETRKGNEEIRQANEELRIKEHDRGIAAAEEAEKQAARAKEQADHPPMQGENGNWWNWNDETDRYEDTGIVAKGGIFYPTFAIEPEDMHLYMTVDDEGQAGMMELDTVTGELMWNINQYQL